MVVQKDQLLLRFLKLRVVVNGHYIYPLAKDRPIVIEMPTNPARLVVTDGFHITDPVELRYSSGNSQFFKIVCAIEDEQLLVGFVLIAAFYIVGATSDLALLQLLGMVPIFYFLFLYYIRRRAFIQIRPA